MFPDSEGCFFQQDDAPCHTARSIKVWISRPEPPLMKRKMDGHKPGNMAELPESLRWEWHKVMVKDWWRALKISLKSILF